MLKEDKLSHYVETYKIEWADSLPENCPPEDILIPEDEEFYRFIKNDNKIVQEDWISYAKLSPNKYNGNDLILASGLSVLKNIDTKKIIKLPAMKHHKAIAKIILNPTDGVLKKTGNNKDHYTWWRTSLFDDTKAEILKI